MLQQCSQQHHTEFISSNKKKIGFHHPINFLEHLPRKPHVTSHQFTNPEGTRPLASKQTPPAFAIPLEQFVFVNLIGSRRRAAPPPYETTTLRLIELSDSSGGGRAQLILVAGAPLSPEFKYQFIRKGIAEGIRGKSGPTVTEASEPAEINLMSGGGAQGLLRRFCNSFLINARFLAGLPWFGQLKEPLRFGEV